MNRIFTTGLGLLVLTASFTSHATFFSHYSRYNDYRKRVSAPPPGPTASCEYELRPDASQPGRAKVTVFSDKRIRIELSGARRNILYTVWTDHRNRGTGKLADDYPLTKLAEPRGVAPTFASTAGVTNGMGLDPNSIVTDGDGNASWEVQLDYDLLSSGSSPVVAAGFAKRGENIYGGSWLRRHERDANKGPSVQLLDPETGLPQLFRSTPQGITIVWHPEKVSHGHSPGVANLDHFPAFADDFPFDCKGR